MLKLYNSISLKKETFESLEKGKARLYVCGITPYDTTHIGHAFTYIHFDVLIRLLSHAGYDVNYTQNVTDIDNDILRKAKEVDKNWIELGNFWTLRFLEDTKALNMLSPTHYVKATGSIPTIIKIIEDLLAKEIAYQSGGNVYFDIKKFSEYGKLSKLSEKEMIVISAERGADPKDPNKRNPLDFILWQESKPGEPSWEASFGKGRPGWHIECSAMNYDNLGKQIDIHGGGLDLKFPHHESEIAQSESFTGMAPFTKYWMHTEMVLHQGEKMAKSVGNLVMIKDLLEKYDPDSIRLLLLCHHYRTPWEFTFEKMELADEKMKFLKETLSTTTEEISLDKVVQLLENDLDTPTALKYLIEQAKSGKNVKKALKLLGFTL